MVAIFPKKDPRRSWGGYKFWFYPGEFIPPINKSLKDLHIHVIGKAGDIRVYLNSDLKIEKKYRGIPEHKWGDIKAFIKKHYNYIISRVEDKLRGSGNN